MDLSNFWPGHIEPDTIWRLKPTDVMNEEKRAECDGYRIRVLAPHPDGGWIEQRVLHGGRAPRMDERELTVIPEINLRLLYEPVES